MKQGTKVELRKALIAGVFAVSGAVVAAQPVIAQAPTVQPRRTPAPEDLLPAPAANTRSAPAVVPPTPTTSSGAPVIGVPEVQPLPVAEPVMAWSVADARALLAVIDTIDSEGLFAKDYQPEALRAAVAGGAGPGLDAVASKSFAWLAEDLRDGRTPMEARVQWFAVDPDQDDTPTSALMTKALTTHNVAGVLADLAPVHPDYQALKAALATTPRADAATRSKIRVNMDRWRWLRRDLGEIYLIANVPEDETAPPAPTLPAGPDHWRGEQISVSVWGGFRLPRNPQAGHRDARADGSELW